MASVTVTVYPLAIKPLAFADAPPEGDQAYAYPGDPPFAITDAVPLAAPQFAEVLPITKTIGVGCAIAALIIAVHAFASVTVTV